MINKNSLKYLVFGLTAMTILSACNDDKESSYGDLRKVTVLTFEDTGILPAGPTSEGQNLYAEYEGARFTQGTIVFMNGEKTSAVEFGLNTTGFFPGTATLYNGGVFLSSFNYRSNPAGETGDWWYTYMNQCSVYNTESVDGANQKAGAEQSNTFAIINGCCNPQAISQVYGAGEEVKLPTLNFGYNEEFMIGKLEVCNTSYTYGSIVNGNSMSAPLTSNKGWLKVLAYGYDADGIMTNGGKPVVYVICDYSKSPQQAIEDDWEEWNLSDLGMVNKVVFNFEGSNTDEWGLLTPAYLAIDNVEIWAK